MVDATLEDPTESDNVVRFLDDNADIETSFGGNFVDSIDGFAGSTSGGGDEDWFFFVNGYYSDVGAGETDVNPGDRVWWDYRYWSAAYRVPAVVGSWPEPFLHGYAGKTYDTIVECVGPGTVDPCGAVIGSLRDAGVKPQVDQVSRPVEHPDQLRILVGPWDAIRSDPAARQIESGPEQSGVYGRMTRCGTDWLLEADDSHGKLSTAINDAGLVAAVRENDDQPTWVVTGTDDQSVGNAAALLDPESLGDRYAVAATSTRRGAASRRGVPDRPVPSPDLHRVTP